MSPGSVNPLYLSVGSLPGGMPLPLYLSSAELSPPEPVLSDMELPFPLRSSSSSSSSSPLLPLSFFLFLRFCRRWEFFPLAAPPSANRSDLSLGGPTHDIGDRCNIRSRLAISRRNSSSSSKAPEGVLDLWGRGHDGTSGDRRNRQGFNYVCQPTLVGT